MSVIQSGIIAAALLAYSLAGGVCDPHGGRQDVPAGHQGALDKQLFTAVNSGNVAQVRLLLTHGADPNTRFRQAQCGTSTVLMEAAALGELPIVKALLSHGANVNARGYSCTLNAPRAEGDYRDSTALIEACLRDDGDDMISVLIASGANVNATDRSGGTALSAVVWKSDWAEAGILLRRGAHAGRAQRRAIEAHLRSG